MGAGNPILVCYEWDDCKIQFLLACTVDGDEVDETEEPLGGMDDI